MVIYKKIKHINNNKNIVIFKFKIVKRNKKNKKNIELIL
jgi:hypothetical protein